MFVRILTALAVCVTLLAELAIVAPAHARAPSNGYDGARSASPVTESDGRLILAQACLSRDEIRAAVKSGQAQPLSRLIGQIQARAGGEVLPNPQLCRAGGRLVYQVNVLTGGGKVRQLIVDAASGAIQGL